ncbi:MAG TPA: 16S rRNA (cytosine(967)-C(5))-methyltransferase RsmB [Povalibacter sp.]|uniref:16S rRNA (cytosine(967)-C(5))-methyltransferase RsmB n=1 Tax=Povalibacter sp. TaxID=1962978 RepID=UPI002CA2194D|nr:16S rRNA (cytosine(967)-C(5))-methyltransferase RsmB [Povalibacter sp.]HMN45218.1 16S rRNA (cytosine(967)-C(5))-methyltransferase RsmB [Povalibacter sp.]
MSRSAAIRARAARIVAQVAFHGRSLDAALAADAAGTPQERGLLRSLCYDSIRWYLRLDALLKRLLTRPGQTLDPDLHALVIVGLAQLLYTDIPAHAAVDETVNAVRNLRQPRAAGLVNAILRRCQREGAKLGEQIDRDPAVRTAHPAWLVSALEQDWPDRAPSILAANNERPPFWLRVNRRRIAGSDYRRQLEASGHEIAASLFDDHALRLARAIDVHELPGFAAGLVSVQDAAAQLAAFLLDPEAGHRVLDACAAPGGKTCHLLELQPRVAELIAIDVSKERLTRVDDNLRRLQLSATVFAADAAEPAQWWDGQPFDRILLDVPCSATGVIRRHADIKLLRRAEDIPVLVQRQKELLARAWPMLRPGGRLLYASCSVLKAETRDVVGDFLDRTPDARDTTQHRLPTLPADVTAGMRSDGPGQAILTGTAGMDGFYYACLEKQAG